MTQPFRYESWRSTLSDGTVASHSALWLGGEGARLLVIPALFDEGNKLRRFTIEVMRRLAGSGICCVMPDLPGLQDSTFPLAQANLALWRGALRELAQQTGATAALAIRGGALARPAGLGGWDYAPTAGASILRQMIRARVLAAREAGREESSEALLAQGAQEGLELAGFHLGAAMIRDLGEAKVTSAQGVSTITQDLIGGPGLWLRAEPGENATQADALAAIVALAIKDAA